MKCPYCSLEQDDGNTFCANCGANLKASEIIQQEPSIQPPLQPEQPPYQQPYQQPYGQPYQQPYQQQPYQQPYQQQPYYQQDPSAAQAAAELAMAEKKAKNALIWGIVGLLCCGFAGIAALIMGIQARSELARLKAPTGTAIAAIVLGAIAIGWWIISFIWNPYGDILDGLI